MEPITYLLGYSAVWLGIALHYMTGRAFTYDGVRSLLAERKAAQLFRLRRVDLGRYHAVRCSVADLERRIAQLPEAR